MRNDSLFSADHFTRRQVMTGLAASLLACSVLPSNLYGDPPKTKKGGPHKATAKSVIFIRVSGGLSHVDSFDIKEQNKDALRASKPIKTSADGIQVGRYFEGIAKHMDKCAIVNSMQHTQGVHEHGQYLMDTGYVKNGNVVHPDLGAWISRFGDRRSGDIPPFVKVGNAGRQGAGFLSGAYGALLVPDPNKGVSYISPQRGVSDQRFDQRFALLDQVNDKFSKKVKNRMTDDYQLAYQDAVKLMRSEDLAVFDLSKEKDKTRESYGNNQFGQGCLLARRLVESGISFVSVNHGGWDHHYDIYSNSEGISGLAPSLDQGIAALLDDLSSSGLLETTMVVIGTEFGRDAHINTKGGRGHNPSGYSVVLAGGGIKGGQKYGATDAVGQKAVKNVVHPKDLHSTIGYALGMPIDEILYSKDERPFSLGHDGKPIVDLF